PSPDMHHHRALRLLTDLDCHLKGGQPVVTNSGAIHPNLQPTDHGGILTNRCDGRIDIDVGQVPSLTSSGGQALGGDMEEDRTVDRKPRGGLNQTTQPVSAYAPRVDPRRDTRVPGHRVRVHSPESTSG